MDKDLRKLLAEAERQGFEWKTTKRGHINVSRNGAWVTTFAGTASDHRSMRNGLAHMKRAGFQWPPKR